MIRRLGKLLIVLMMLRMMGQVFPVAQEASAQMQQMPPPSEQRERNAEDALPPEQKRELEKKRNEKRQQEIKVDTDKLLELATELKQYVDKSNENLLSMDVIKKAEQIEKLAHSVKEKMKGQ